MLRSQLHADLETPVSCYLKLRAGADHSFLLESVEGAESWATYSIIGVGARASVEVRQGQLTSRPHDGAAKTQPFAALMPSLRTALAMDAHAVPADAPPFVGGWFGFFAYDSVRYFERLPGVGGAPGVSDAAFFQPELLAVFDNRRHSLTLYAHDEARLLQARRALRGPLPPQLPCEAWQEPTARDARPAFENAVEQAKEHIRRGDIIQVVLSRRFELPALADPFDVYRGLRLINPSPYLYYVETPTLRLAGASPETMLRVRDGQAVVRPIAGTRRRGHSPAEDARLAEELLADPKERAEHIMLVDLGRNDLGRVSAPGSVRVPDLMLIERYSHVMHIVSEVRGTLAPGLDAFDAVQAAFPAGTLSGAPKVRAMQIIDQLEGTRRGIYGGAVGYFGPRGDADFGIAIRTLVAHDARFVVRAGAGIVADSDPGREADETEHKAQAVLRACQWATSAESRY